MNEDEDLYRLGTTEEVPVADLAPTTFPTLPRPKRVLVLSARVFEERGGQTIFGEEVAGEQIQVVVRDDMASLETVRMAIDSAKWGLE